jgi:O-antigen ligase
MLSILPITSLPLVTNLLKSDTVAAPSIIILGLLVLFWLLPFLWKRGTLSKLTIPLVAFAFSAFLSTILARYIDIPTFKNFSSIQNNLQSIVTLLIGFGFFIISATYPKNDEILEMSFRVINWSGLIMLVWAGIQILSWLLFHKYFEWMFNFQGLISSRVLYHNRATAFALEPSWFSHQLNMLYIPLWLSASLRKYSSHKVRIFGFTFENSLLMGAVISLFFTFSRGGFIAFLSMVTLIFIYFNVQIVNKLKAAWLQRVQTSKTHTKNISKLIPALVSIAFIVFYLLVIILGAFTLSKIDPRMKNLFEFKTDKENPLLTYFNNLQFGERAVYWLSGWEIFGDHPIFGVGLGNAGFFFPSKITPYGWTLIEIRRLMYEENILLNIKSLWVRILAETGIVGFSIFVTWLVLLATAFIKIMRNRKSIVSMAGLAGIFIIAALPAEGFSIDSFALPYLWIGLGLATSAVRLTENQLI